MPILLGNIRGDVKISPGAGGSGVPWWGRPCLFLINNGPFTDG